MAITHAKVFKSLRAAERYQARLYSRYDYVRLVRSPLFGEEGAYVWQVQR